MTNEDFVRLSASVGLLPEGSIVLLPLDIYEEVALLVRDDAWKNERLPWAGENGLLLFRGHEIGVAEDFR